MRRYWLLICDADFELTEWCIFCNGTPVLPCGDGDQVENGGEAGMGGGEGGNMCQFSSSSNTLQRASQFLPACATLSDTRHDKVTLVQQSHQGAS